MKWNSCGAVPHRLRNGDWIRKRADGWDKGESGGVASVRAVQYANEKAPCKSPSRIHNHFIAHYTPLIGVSNNRSELSIRLAGTVSRRPIICVRRSIASFHRKLNPLARRKIFPSLRYLFLYHIILSLLFLYIYLFIYVCCVCVCVCVLVFQGCQISLK